MTRIARNARIASRALASAPASQRTAALQALSDCLRDREDEILAANATDMDTAMADGLEPHLLARLKLTSSKIDGLRDGLGQLLNQADPVGTPLRKTQLDDGLVLTQVTSPLGVLLVIFESRPDAVIQIGGLALRTGNGLILKGGREAKHSNAILVECLRTALDAAGLPRDGVCGVEGRQAVHELLDCDDDIDLVIPRGSADLVRTIQSSSRIPVMGHADGICHLYIDSDADLSMAKRIAIDGKCDYPAACNATESMLVHRDFLDRLRPLGAALSEAGVSLKACPEASQHLDHSEPAGDADGATEYGNLTLSVRVVGGLEEAVERIHSHGSGHTESIVTGNAETAAAFLASVDSASVFHNASTRFADGYRYGLGAEVGISTGRIHARGPVGADGLLTTRWLLRGQGQIAADYSGQGARTYQHRSLPIEPKKA